MYTATELIDLITEVFDDIETRYDVTFSPELRTQAFKIYINELKTIDEIRISITNILTNMVNRYKKGQELKSEFTGPYYSPINIIERDITTIPYEELNNILFHYSKMKYLSNNDQKGMQPAIGENSLGIDNKPSIFYSKGVEGVLKLWDVWLKWRLNKIFDPSKKDLETQKRFHKKDITSDEEKEWGYWLHIFNTKKAFENPRYLIPAFDYELIEMQSSNYFNLLLQEGTEYLEHDIDENKVRHANNIPRQLQVIYGDYSDFTITESDDWNKHTILGKEFILPPSRIELLTVNGNKDVYSILTYLYHKYLEQVPVSKRTKFDVLDEFIKYSKNKIEEPEIISNPSKSFQN